MNERADNPLEGKRILVLGDPSGVGHYVAVTIQKNKCRVFITGQIPNAVDGPSDTSNIILGCELLTIPEQAMIKKTLVQFGDVHHLVVVNDGHLIYPPDDAQTEDMMLTTILHACEILTTRVSQTGSVLFILNSRIREDEHTLSNFASALDEKLRTYAKQLAKQRAPLRVNIITTNLAAHAVFCKMPVAQRKRALHSISERLPLRRRFSPKYLADAVVFLLGNEFITNADIPVDGGESL